MSEFFGDGTSRTLSAKTRQFVNVVWKQGKPPLDSELNLIAQINSEAQRSFVSSTMSSGWVSNVLDPMADFSFDEQASNMFWLGNDVSDSEGDIIWANVNGWLVPVTGTNSSDARNAILLPPPKVNEMDSDVNFVFLEVWQTRVEATGSVNKPASNLLYRYGNVEYGGTNIENDIIDPQILMETTERVQLQYRLRVEPSVSPTGSPYGFSAGVKAQGTMDNPTTSTHPDYRFTNMGDELGDPGLWRAGSGDGENDPLGTVDGYVYAIPLCFVFRRTRNNWSILQQHGATDRNPEMTDRSEASVLPTVMTIADLDREGDTLEVNTTVGSTTFDPAGGLLKINDEIVEYSSYVGTTITLTERGAKSTHVASHDEGSTINFVTGHPLGLFSDQIISDDVLDLRHILSTDGLDYDGILRQNFGQLLKGELTSSWKKSTASVKGRKHFQVDYFGPSSSAPDHTISADRPDGLRKIFSDACTLQPGNLAILGSTGTTESPTDLTTNPSVSILREESDEWNVNDTVLLDLDQFRASIPLAAPNNRKVRFVHPFEYDGAAHSPVRVWFGDSDPTSGDAHKTAPLSLESTDSDPWFMVLGSEVEDLSTPSSGQSDIIFDPAGALDIDGTTFTTQDGADLVDLGAWILILPGTAGANVNPENRGAYKITGVDGAGRLLVEKADGDVPAFTATTNNRTWQLRVPSCSEDDTDLALVLVRDAGGNLATDATLHLTYDLLYHPARGISRVPENALEVEMFAGVDSNYVRENTHRNVATSSNPTVKKSRAIPLAAYPHHHNKKFQIRDPQDVAGGTETVWAESYVDRGSKTLLYQPLRNVEVRLDPQDNPATIDYTDATGIFHLNTSAPNSCVLIPKELRAPLGRLDLPFVTSTTNAGGPNAPAYGINCTLHSGSSSLNTSKLVEQRVRFLYDPTSTGPADFGTWDTILNITGDGPQDNALVCRFYDKGGVRGIELPPHYGIARLFAAHFLEEYDGTSIFSLNSDFRTPSGVSRLNLLRTDSDRRSLIITDDNTFVIPEDVLDSHEIQLNGTGGVLCPVTGQNFESLIFEAATFIFDDWTADLMRVHRRDDANAILNSADFRMFVNGPSEAGDTFHLISTRVPYQGSIHGTMPVSADDSDATEHIDYQPKRNTERPQNVLDLFTALAQDEARVSNPATLEILASMPFATTLGTGALSGNVVPGSYTDVGYLSLEHYPYSDVTDSERRSSVRAHPFTTGGNSVAPALSEALSGITERLPIGMIVSDYQFLGEGFGPEYKRLWKPDVSMDAGGDYRDDKMLDKPREEGALVFSDGTSGLTYSSNFQMYRTHRGGTVMSGGVAGGGAVVLSGGRASKDLSYLNDPDEHNHKIHGAVLFGVAFLVRNTKEAVTDSALPASYGDEVQMVVLTGITLGSELDLSGDITKEFIDLLLQMHPGGAGEGYCAADRFRVMGRPLQKTMRNSKTALDVFRGRDPS